MAAKNKIDYFTITVWNDRWNVYQVSESDDVLLEDTSKAEIDLENKEIHFKSTKLKDIKHELFHLYVDYTMTSSAQLEGWQVEELCCEIYSNKGDEIGELAKEVFEKIKGLHAS